MTELFEADVSNIMSFAILEGCRENEYGNVSRLAVAKSSEDGTLRPTYELIDVSHSDLDNFATSVVSRMKTFETLETRVARLDIALFAGRGEKTNNCQVLAACRTDHSISMFMLTKDGETLPRITDETYVCKDKDMGLDRDAVTIAQSLVETPLSSLLHEQALEQFQAELHICVNSIGESEDQSCAILDRLLAVTGKIHELTRSSPRSSSLLPCLLQWNDKIQEMSCKWTTFQLLRNSLAKALDMTLSEQWQNFQTMTTHNILLHYIKVGSMRAVRILWNRHADDNTVQNIGMLLESLPSSISLSAYAPWIQNGVLPSLLTYVEQVQSIGADNDVRTKSRELLAEVAIWLLNKAEAAAAQSDVDSAIGICNLMISANEDVQIDTFIHVWDGYEMPMSNELDEIGRKTGAFFNSNPFKRLEHLHDKLRQVQGLAVEHQFIISFSLFKDETPATIAMSMLDRASDAMSLKKEVEEHVRRYLHCHNVDVDPVLYDYVMELAESISTCECAEESRTMVLLDEILDVNLRVNATLAFLRCVVPPYSDELKKYITKCTKWKIERIVEIKERVSLMEIQDMLTKYNIKHYDPTDAKSASRYVSHILNCASMATAFKDAMLLIDANSVLPCDRAAVRYTESLFSDFDTGTSELFDEVSLRVAKAMEAFAEVKKRSNSTSSTILYVSIMEEIVEFGVLLLEAEAHEKEEAGDKSTRWPQSFVLCLLQSLVAAYLPELKLLFGFASDVLLSAYVESSDFLLSDALLTDLQRICQIEAEFGLLLSISAIRDSEMCKKKLKCFINPAALFPKDEDENERAKKLVRVTSFVRAKGKKRARASTQHTLFAAKKRQRTSERHALPSINLGLQQDDKKSRFFFDLNRFASALGIDAKTCQVLVAQSAVDSGSILHAVRIFRELFTTRSYSGISSNYHDMPDQTGSLIMTDLAVMSKKAALSLLLHLSCHVKEIYDEPLPHHPSCTPAILARARAPMYALEMLRHSLCMCDKEDFDETLLLLKKTILIYEALQLTQHIFPNIMTDERRWTLYPCWYRGDACPLASYETMKLVTKFALIEHKNFGYESQDEDLIAFKRYIFFLVEERADLLSLQALISVQQVPEEVACVANTQMITLLSSVFQSQEIDNHLALGYICCLIFLFA